MASSVSGRFREWTCGVDHSPFVDTHCSPIASQTGCRHLGMYQGPSLKWEGQNSGTCVSHHEGTGFERQSTLSKPKIVSCIQVFNVAQTLPLAIIQFSGKLGSLQETALSQSQTRRPSATWQNTFF